MFRVMSLLCLLGCAAVVIPGASEAVAFPFKQGDSVQVQPPTPQPAQTLPTKDVPMVKDRTNEILESLSRIEAKEAEFDKRLQDLESQLSRRTSAAEAALRSSSGRQFGGNPLLVIGNSARPIPRVTNRPATATELQDHAKQKTSAQARALSNPRAFRTGGFLHPDPVAHARSLQAIGSGRFRASVSFGQSSESEFDIRTTLRTARLHVRDQMDCGSCWDFAAVAAFEASYAKQFDEEADASEQFVLDEIPLGDNGLNTCGGGFVTDAVHFLANKGTIRLGDMGGVYVAERKPGRSQGAAPVYLASAAGTVDLPGGLNTIAVMKTAIKENGAVAAFMTVSDDFKEFGTTHRDPGDVYPGNPIGATENHFVCVIGWSDTKGAWLIKNSWNPDLWGHTAGFGSEKGYMWVKYNTCAIGEGVVAFVQAAHSDVTGPVRPVVTQDNDVFAPEVIKRLDWWRTDLRVANYFAK